MTIGGICYRKGKERGAWYEIECMKQSIIGREAGGQRDNFGRDLLKAWSEYPGYEGAEEALNACNRAYKQA